jgi:hypothetical protein
MNFPDEPSRFGVAVAGLVTGLFVGALAMADAPVVAVQVVWDAMVLAFLFFSWVGAMSELQVNETIDLGRLLHLPVALWDVFHLNYALSNFRMSVVIWFPTMLGLAIGLVWGRGPWFIAMIPLVLTFHYMATAWLCWLRGWLTNLVVNAWRRRVAGIAVTLFFMMIMQTPLMLSRYVAHRTKTVAGGEEEVKAQVKQWIEYAHCGIPILWLPQAGRALAEHRPLTAAGCGVGMILVGWMGMRWAFRNTLRFHQGVERKTSEVTKETVRKPRRLFVERQIPWVPDPVSAMALTNLRALLRASEVRLNIGVIVMLMAGACVTLWGRGLDMGAGHLFAASGAVMATFFCLGQVMFNLFGFDRDGFRSLVLSPVDRAHVLAGKNVSVMLMSAVVFLLFLVITSAGFKLGLFLVLASCFQFGAAFLLMSVAGNMASILAPYRMASGDMRATRMSWLSRLILWLMQIPLLLVFLLILAPAGIGAFCGHLRLLSAEPVVAAMSALLMVVAAVAYGWALNPSGRLLARREQAILLVVTHEVE